MLCRLGFAVGFALALGSAAGAQDLRIGLSGEITSIDPHFETDRFNTSAHRHIFQPLVIANAKMAPQPLLAESWKRIEGVPVWEIRLRQGVRFQNGVELTSRDVIYSFCRVVSTKGGAQIAGFISLIETIKATGPYTIEFTTRGPDPQLPSEIASVGIVQAQGNEVPIFNPKGCNGADWGDKAAFNDGRLANGTGPYRLKSINLDGERGSKHLILTRNDQYWGKRPDWQQVTFNFLPDDNLRMASLLAGDVDIIEDPGIEDLEMVRKDPSLHLAETSSIRIIHLDLNQVDQPAPGTNGTNGVNPSKDKRVREAISLAIDRKAICQQLMRGRAIPASQLVGAGLFGYDPELPVRFDPEKARTLLAEAGYPNGFDLIIHGPNDRYLNDDKILATIASMLRQIGIRTEAISERSSDYFPRRNKYQFSMLLMGLNINSGEMSGALRLIAGTRNTQTGAGAYNFGRYSNPELDRMLTDSAAIIDDTAREVSLRQASRLAMEDYGVLPLHLDAAAWAMRSNLTYAARADQRTFAWDIHPR